MSKNIKVIIGIILGMILVSGVSVYATLTYNAGDIAYTKSGASTPISVSSALNELYQNKKDTTDDVKNVTANGNIILDKYYKNLNVNIPIPAGYIQPSGTKTITTKANNIDVSNYQYADTTGMYTAAEYAAKTGEGEYWYKDTNYTMEATEYTINLGFRPSVIIEQWDHPSGGHFIAFKEGNKVYAYETNSKEISDWSDYYTFSETGYSGISDSSWIGAKGKIYALP